MKSYSVKGNDTESAKTTAGSAPVHKKAPRMAYTDPGDDELEDMEDMDSMEEADSADDAGSDGEIPEEPEKPRKNAVKSGKLKDSGGFEVEAKDTMWKTNDRKEKHRGKKRDEKGQLSTDMSWTKRVSRMTTGDWLLTLAILAVPAVLARYFVFLLVIDIVLFIIWGFFSDTVQEEKKNFSRAATIVSAAAVALILILNITVGGLNRSFISERFGQFLNDAKEDVKKSIDSEMHDTKDNADGLTDDDFTDD